MKSLGPISKRTFLRVSLLSGVAALLEWRQPLIGSAEAAPGSSLVGPEETLDAALKRLFGDRQIKYDEHVAVELIVPQMAENGRVVPMEVNVKGFAAERSIKRIYVIVDNNKRPVSVVFDFTQGSAIGYVAANLRMGATSIVRAVCETDDGLLYGAKKMVPVVVGGCGG